MDPAQPQPHSFQEFLTWLEINKTRVITITAIVAAVIAITVLYIRQEAQREIRASEALSEITTPANQLAPLPPETREAYLAFAANHGGTKAAARAILRVAGSDFTQTNYAEAQGLFERFLREYPTSEWADQAALGLAASLEALNQTDAAAAKYEDVRARYANTSVGDEATLGLARIYQAQGKKEEAIKLYHGLSESSQSSVGTRANMRKTAMIDSDPSLTNAIAPLLPATPAMAPIPSPTVVTATSSIPITATSVVTAPLTSTNVPQAPLPTEVITNVPVPIPEAPPQEPPAAPVEEPKQTVPEQPADQVPAPAEPPANQKPAPSQDPEPKQDPEPEAVL